MFENGIYVSFMRDDLKKIKAPRSVVSVNNGNIDIYINPDADESTKTYLKNILSKKPSMSEDEYKEHAYVYLSKYFESNGYTPNPSDFFEMKNEKGKNFMETAKSWK